MSQVRTMVWSVRWTICLILGGLAAYNYVPLDCQAVRLLSIIRIFSDFDNADGWDGIGASGSLVLGKTICKSTKSK
jgi:hypothetical protein